MKPPMNTNLRYKKQFVSIRVHSWFHIRSIRVYSWFHFFLALFFLFPHCSSEQSEKQGQGDSPLFSYPQNDYAFCGGAPYGRTEKDILPSFKSNSLEIGPYHGYLEIWPPLPQGLLFDRQNGSISVDLGANPEFFHRGVGTYDVRYVEDLSRKRTALTSLNIAILDLGQISHSPLSLELERGVSYSLFPFYQGLSYNNREQFSDYIHSFSISPSALPPGLSFDPLTGLISGSPQADFDTQYTIGCTGVTQFCGCLTMPLFSRYHPNSPIDNCYATAR